MFGEQKMKKKLITTLALAASLTVPSFADDITPTRIGPVSQFGQLMAGKNSSGKGQIYGSCEGVKDGAEVQVKGMSLYWSLNDEALEFWTDEGISTMVKDMKIQIVRAAMASAKEDWTKGKYQGYELAPDKQKEFVNRVVEAAIKNDIYVIIDWHSHTATKQTEISKAFFSEMAKKWGSYDHVIFEIFNEPKNDVNWNQVKDYANQVVAAIRQYSDNLIIVGNPSWDQNPQQAIGNEVTDSKGNIAYALHYYANSHCWEGAYGWGDGVKDACEGTKGLQAMEAGLSVFMSEWGTAKADGKGTPDENRNSKWQDYMNKHKLSWANWSASKINEGTAAFTGNSNKTHLEYSTSGKLVKGYLSSNPETYTACKANEPESSSSTNLSSSISNEATSSNTEAIVATQPSAFSLKAMKNTILLNTTAHGTAHVEVFDMLGHAQQQKVLQLNAGYNAIDMQNLPAGIYLVRAIQGEFQAQTKIQIR